MRRRAAPAAARRCCGACRATSAPAHARRARWSCSCAAARSAHARRSRRCATREGRLSAQRPATRRALARDRDRAARGRAARCAGPCPGIVVTARLQLRAGRARRAARRRRASPASRACAACSTSSARSSFHVQTDRVPDRGRRDAAVEPDAVLPRRQPRPGHAHRHHRRRHRHQPPVVLRRGLHATRRASRRAWPRASTARSSWRARSRRPAAAPREHTAFDPDGSDHGTHVAGIAAGDVGHHARRSTASRCPTSRASRPTPISATTAC